MLYAGFYSLSVDYQSFVAINLSNRSTAISEKISFKGRQKSSGKQTSSFAIFDRTLACANCKCDWLCGQVICHQILKVFDF